MELTRAWDELQGDDEVMRLALSADDASAFLADARVLVANYFRLEDPTAVKTIGVELGVEIEEDGMRLRGIIDRLDIGPDGALTVVDYKTGRAPSERYETGEDEWDPDVRTALRESPRAGTRGSAPPAPARPGRDRGRPDATDDAGQRVRTAAVWGAIARACVNEDFRPRSDRCASSAISSPRAPLSAPRERGVMSRFDETIDAAFEPLRGRQDVDRAAALVSNLADYGLVWVVLALIKCRRRGPGRRRAVASLGAAGISSYLVNRATKSLVDRRRPEQHLDAPVRTPSSSSFPSGHTLAAFATAFTLSGPPAETAAYVGFAVPWPPVACTCGPITPAMCWAVRPSARSWAWACDRWSTGWLRVPVADPGAPRWEWERRATCCNVYESIFCDVGLPMPVRP